VSSATKRRHACRSVFELSCHLPEELVMIDPAKLPLCLAVLFSLASAAPAQDIDLPKPKPNSADERLQSNQRESGRWFTRSLNTDKYHYITNAGTAFAVLVLKACE
jgi:hypothetical protein